MTPICQARQDGEDGKASQRVGDRPSHVWAFPIETVSQSEGGFELVHQSVVVLPHWYVRADQDGRWSVTMHLDLDTRLAESRMETKEAVVS